MSAKFGPAGNSESFAKVSKSSVDAPRWLAGLGLDCYEYQCGKGVRVSEALAHPNRLDPKNPVYAEETSPSVIVNGFSERLGSATFRESGWITCSLSPRQLALVNSH